MPHIRSVATALPPHALSQERIRDLARAHFAPAFPEIDRYMTVFRHAQIDTRHFAAPLEWFMTPHSFKQCNDLFVEVATALGEQAARACLAADPVLAAGPIAAFVTWAIHAGLDWLWEMPGVSLLALGLAALLVARAEAAPPERRA